MLFANFDADFWVWVTFFLNAVVIVSITAYHIYIERDYSPFISAFIVFSFLFFIVAPVIQIISLHGGNPSFITGFPYKPSLCIYANILILIFNCVFFTGYLALKRSKTLSSLPSVSEMGNRHLPLTIIIILFLSLLIVVASLDFLIADINRPNWMVYGSTSVFLMWKKVLFLVPFAGIALCFQYFNKNGKKASNLLLVLALVSFLIIILFWFKNPFTEKRNALGPIYISLLFLFYPNLLNKNIKTLFLLFFAMVIAFPLSAIVTHTDATFNEVVNDPSVLVETMKAGGITNAFNTLNYDAYINALATLQYVAENGLAWGHQLLSALLFFVPRSLWNDKPISTGELIGDYLIEDYGFNFNNLSNPLISETYINFGIVGIILGAIVLAIVIVKLMSWLRSDDYLKKVMAFYFAIHLLFLLRGDFTNGFSYYIGTLIGALLIPKIISFSLKLIMLKKTKNEST